jgi:hypothetical protein
MGILLPSLYSMDQNSINIRRAAAKLCLYLFSTPLTLTPSRALPRYVFSNTYNLRYKNRNLHHRPESHLRFQPWTYNCGLSPPQSCTKTLILDEGGNLYFGHNSYRFLDLACYPWGSMDSQELTTFSAWKTYYCKLGKQSNKWTGLRKS